MRRNIALLVGFAILASSCSIVPMAPMAPTVPTVVAMSGHETVPLNTRPEVHDALGKPTREGKLDGTPFEEFQIRGGCDRNYSGYRVPAFQPLDEFHVRGWGDLRLIAGSDVGVIPTNGKNLIIVASVNHLLHFQIFDNDGKTVVQTDETKLLAKAGQIADLKKQLASVWPPHTIIEKEKEEIITAVGSIVGQFPVFSFELAVTNMKPFGLGQSTTQLAEDGFGRHRVLPGQTLRFEYESSGKVAKVFLNGEFLFSPTKQTPKTAVVNNQQ